MTPAAQPDYIQAWKSFSSGLPQGLPDEALDAQREVFFERNVLPNVLKGGWDPHDTRQEFMKATEREKASFPRAELVGKTALAAAVAPLEGLMGGTQTGRGIEQGARQATREAQQQGINAWPYQMAGEMVGQAPYWALGMGAAEEVAAGLKATELATRSIKTLTGGLIQGSYDAAKDRSLASGLHGAAWGAGLAGGFELAGPALKGLRGFLQTKGLEPAEAAAVEKVALGTAGEADFKLATDATLKSDHIEKDIAEWSQGQVKAAEKAGVPKSSEVEPLSDRLRLTIRGADGKPYQMGGVKGITLPSLEKALPRIGEHLDAGGAVESVVGSQENIAQFYALLERSRPQGFDLEVPLRGKNGKPIPTVKMQRLSQDEAISLAKVLDMNPSHPMWNEVIDAITAGESKPATRLRPNDEASSNPKSELDEIINARNSYYHATDLEGFEGVLKAGKIEPSGGKEGLEWGETPEGNLANEDAEAELVKAVMKARGWTEEKTQDWLISEGYDTHENIFKEFGVKTALDRARGVSVSRTPRVSSKADKFISFVIDTEKMPRSRPFAEEGYGKLERGTEPRDLDWTISKMTPEEKAEYNQLSAAPNWRDLTPQRTALLEEIRGRAPMNKQFEFEQRTFNEPIPLSAVKGVIIDKSAITPMPFKESRYQTYSDFLVKGDEGRAEVVEQIQNWAKEFNLPVRVVESGKELHGYRAGLSRLSPEERFAVPLYDQLAQLPNGQVYNKYTGEIFNSAEEAESYSPTKYKETPLVHRFSGGSDIETRLGEAAGQEIGAGIGEKPTILLNKTADREDLFHEHLHGHFDYTGIHEWLNNAWSNDVKVWDIYNGFIAPQTDLYQGASNIPEEVFNYVAAAVRTGNQGRLEAFGAADDGLDEVLRWVSKRSDELLGKLSEVSDSLHKRTAERRLGSVITRATDQLEDVHRVHSLNPTELDLGDFTYQVHEGDTVQYFPDREAAVAYMESRFQEPLAAPELVDMGLLPEGMAKAAVKLAAPNGKPPIQSDAPIDELRKPYQAGLYNISYFLRPFLSWVGDVSEKFKRPDLYDRFSAVDTGLIERNNAQAPYVKVLKETLNKYSQERQTDFFKWVQATDAAKPFIEKELKFTPEEIADVQRYKGEFVESLAGPANDLMDYFQKKIPALRAAQWDHSVIYPKGKESGLIGELVNAGRLDPRDTNLLRMSSIYLNKVMHNKYVEPHLTAAEDLLKEKSDVLSNSGQAIPQWGTLKPRMERTIAYLRGEGDPTSRLIRDSLEGVRDGINSALESVNKRLPKDIQVPLLEAAPEDIIDKYILFSYAGSLALRPGVWIRDATGGFLTSYPLLGNYFFKGMAKAFPGIKQGAEGSVWTEAQKYGVFIEKHELRQMIESGGQLEMTGGQKLTDLVEKGLTPQRWADNGNRLIGFWGFQQKVSDALENFRTKRDPELFAKEADLWFLNPGAKAKYLKELQTLPESGLGDFSKRAAKDLVEATQWSYRPGARPGVYNYQLGRLLGQYGTWPLNYIEYMRKYASNVNKSEALPAFIRFAAAHGAVLSAGRAVGVDTGQWTFTQPMAYGGGPIFTTIANIPQSFDFQTTYGEEARRQIKRLVWPGIIPGGAEAESIWKSVNEDSQADAFWRIVGLTPLEEKNEQRGWYKVVP